jgi:hypothetical protein
VEPQIIKTDKYGDLRVIQGYHESKRVVFLLENGCYVSDTGRPIEDEEELREAIPLPYLPPALDWLKHKDDVPEDRPRKIIVTAKNLLVFEDGTPVTNVQDIISFYEPGPFREAALIAFADKLRADKGLAPEKPKKVAQPVRPADTQPKQTKGKKRGKPQAQGKKSPVVPAEAAVSPVVPEQPSAAL